MQRFKHHGTSHSKVDTYVQFPINKLNISRFVSSNSTKTSPLYDLFAVIEHAGTLQQGHYVAYIRRQNDWFRCNDAKIQRVSERQVLQSRAYMLYYSRTPPSPAIVFSQPVSRAPVSSSKVATKPSVSSSTSATKPPVSTAIATAAKPKTNVAKQ